MNLPSLGLVRLTPPAPEDVDDVGVGLNSGTGDLTERVRRHYTVRGERMLRGAETGDADLVAQNLGRTYE